MTRVKINGAKIHIPCEMIDSQILSWLTNIRIPKKLMPHIKTLYHQHIEQLSSPGRDEQIAKLTEQIKQLRTEEADLGRMVLHRRISQEAYDQLRMEWQQRLSHKQQELEALRREPAGYIDELEIAIKLLSKIPVLFERLAKREQARLLKLLLYQVDVDEAGNIIGVQLNSPFAYLHDLAQIAAGKKKELKPLAVSDYPENHIKRMVFAEQNHVAEMQTLVGASD